MSDKQNFRDYGQQFKTELDEALNTGDFTNLNALVKDTVRSSVADVATQVRRAADSVREAGANINVSRAAPSFSSTGQEIHYAQGAERRAQRESMPARAQAQMRRSEAAIYKKVGDISGTLLQVFGGIGMGIFGLLFLIFLMIYLIGHVSGFLPPTIIFMLLLGGFIYMLSRGNSIKGRLSRSERYYQLGRKNGYVNIRQLAEAVNRKEEQVIKDIRALIGKRVFPQGHLDREEKCFILTDETYEQYQQLAAQRAQLEEEQARKRLDDSRKVENLTEEQRALQEMVDEGRRYIAQIRQRNDQIPGEVFSQKLYRMENLLENIFVKLETTPGQMSKMHRLMNYYLPTTLKLVTAYVEFDRAEVQSGDVADAKREIENTVDTINDAFEELLQQLFANTAMDVTTDAQVLKTMLAKEGLAKDDFAKQTLQ